MNTRCLTAGTAVAEAVDLQRFLWAQDGVIEQAMAELQAGRKTSHWMWFVFPQVVGLGHSASARRYAIYSTEEARAFLAHPELGSRLRRCCALLLEHGGTAPEQIFGVVDALKLRSSMTLFDAVCSGDVFADVLTGFYGGERDSLSLAVIGGWRE